MDDSVIKRMVSTFHPGFLLPDGTLINTFTVAHHGGSQNFVDSRKALLAEVPAIFTKGGGPADADEVRVATNHQILFQNKLGDYEIQLQARLFQRNTTSLYGAGLLNQISDKTIQDLAKQQKKHSEISGRPSNLGDGRLGKFGWRANVASLVEFTDQASANELGLETKRKEQAADPMVRRYRNPGTDISDAQVEAMRDFIAALPVPTRVVSADSRSRLIAEHGERMFASVGCAACHVPNVGPAKGVYSDILLHDMGWNSVDLNHAEPYITRVTPAQHTELVSTKRHEKGSRMVGGTPYYGPATEIRQVSVDRTTYTTRPSSFRKTRRSPVQGISGAFEFVVPRFPSQSKRIFVFSTRDQRRDEERDHDVRGGSVKVKEQKVFRTTKYVRVRFEPTNFNQEWRTPPLWGVADSAPYMHDGRAGTLLESIAMHDGEAAGTRDRFLNLTLQDRRAIIAFLETLVAPPSAPKLAM